MSLSNKNLPLILFLALITVFVASCAKKQARIEPGISVNEEGYASWYGPGFHGRRTASGERYNMWKMTAAHKELPFGTVVKVTNKENEKSVIVKINDRGPFKPGRVIDLSKAAAKEIGLLRSGVAMVVVEILTDEEGANKEEM